MIPNFTMNRMRISTVLFIVALVVVLTDAFISPTQQRVQQQHHYSYSPPTPSTTTLLKALPEFIYTPSVMLSDGLSAATYMTTQDEFNSAMSAGNGPLGALRTFFIVITAAVFGITALIYLTAAFLVPRAAEQLEKDTKRLQPGLWEEYQEKLRSALKGKFGILVSEYLPGIISTSSASKVQVSTVSS